MWYHEDIKFIPKKDLEIGAWYEGRSRNASQARWSGSTFEYIRRKFSDAYIDSHNHPEDDNGFALFFPLNRVEDKGVTDDLEATYRSLRG